MVLEGPNYRVRGRIRLGFEKVGGGCPTPGPDCARDLGARDQASVLPVTKLDTKSPRLAPWTPGTPHFCWPPGPLQTGSIQLNTSGRVYFAVNKLYLETHRGWEMEQTPPETTPETADRHGPG